jgi:hypothetical protein
MARLSKNLPAKCPHAIVSRKAENATVAAGIWQLAAKDAHRAAARDRPEAVKRD